MLAHGASWRILRPHGEQSKRGALQPEFREEWEPRLHYFYTWCLLPEWWPEGGPSGLNTNPQDRLDEFELNLDAVLPSSSTKGSGMTSPAAPTLTPQSVLNSLLLLRSAVAPEENLPTLN
jgi:hypothetical protein